MERLEAEQRLFCAMTIGELMLVSGAEVGRVEDTIRRICLALGMRRVDVFTITTSIVTTVYGEGFCACTQSRRVPGMAYDMSRLDKLNEISRRICEGGMTHRQALEQIDALGGLPRYSFGAQLLIYALISGAFSLFFGGSAADAAASALIGALLRLAEPLLERGVRFALPRRLLCGCLGGLLARLSVAAGLGAHADLISIGNIMLLIPGIAFTNSMRDLFSGDTITGAIRFAESLLMAVGIALGFALVGFVF